MKNISIISFILLTSQISLAKQIAIGDVQVDLDKNHQQNLQHFNEYFEKKFGSYEKLITSATIPEKDQQLIYYRNETVVKLLLEDIVAEKDLAISEKLFTKADEFDQDDLDFDTLSDSHKKALVLNSKKVFKLQYFVSFNFLAVQYKLEGLNASGTKIAIISQESGNCYGGGVAYGNQTWEARLEGCYGNLKATVNDRKNQEYGPHNLETTTAIISTGVYWKPNVDLAIGLSPTYHYHQADYTYIKHGSTTDKNKNTIGYMVGMHWYVMKDLDFNINIGDAQGYEPGILKFGINYTVL